MAALACSLVAAPLRAEPSRVPSDAAKPRVDAGAPSPTSRAESPLPTPERKPVPFARPGWLGVTMTRGNRGVVVEHVVRGSPAEAGGVRVGDRIVAFEGSPVRDPADVTQKVAAACDGDRAKLTVAREDRSIDLSVVLVPRPTVDELLRMDLVGAPLPAWRNVKPLVGAPSSPEELVGSVVLVDFWASFCAPCRMLAPRISALKDRFGAQGLRVVGITTDTAEKAATFAEQVQMRYPIVVDEEGATMSAYGITGLPTMLLVDKRGLVRDVFVGFSPADEPELVAKIKALLAEPSADASKPSNVPTPSQRTPSKPGAR